MAASVPLGSPQSGALPKSLKTGIEALSGIAMDDVRVHRGSPKPAAIGAHAYAQGRDIHLSPGQDRHLPHEAWHVVQQATGTVPATARHGGTKINDDGRLEAEAETMGARAARQSGPPVPRRALRPLDIGRSGDLPAQCVGHIRFANLSTTPKYVAKGQAIITGLQDTPSIANYLANKDVLITLKWDPQLATVSVVGDQVQITLSPWFFEQESRGRILGMLAHEFGVHPVATAELAAMAPPPPAVLGGPPALAPLAQEHHDITSNTHFPTGVLGLDMVPGNAVQMDHVFAMSAGQPRFRIYQRTVHEMARGLLQRVNAAAPGAPTAAHVTDLIMTYLADIAMVLATNDHRTNAYSESVNTAAIFNLERTRWLAMLANGDAIDAQLAGLTPPVKTSGDVRSEVHSTILKLGLSLFTGSTTDANYDHANAMGVVAATNIVQQDVLGDHGLALAPLVGVNADDLFDAILAAGGPPHTRVTARAGLSALLDQGTYNWVTAHPQIRVALTWKQLNDIANALNHTIRVLMPDGKMMQSGNHGPRLTLVWVTKPNPHYRAAV